MKTLGIIMTIGLSVVILILLGGEIYGRYQYEKQFQSYWELAVKASSITKKIEGIDKFVDALDHSRLQGKYDALFLETPNNSFDENFAALKSLQTRLHEISGMDITSFQYQTALAQITQQEQNEAEKMLRIFSGIWWKENHFWLWGWPSVLLVSVLTIGVIIGFSMWAEFN